MTATVTPAGVAGEPRGKQPPAAAATKPGAATRLMVRWGDRTPVQGARSVITGQVPALRGHADRAWSVALQTRHGTWRPYLETKSGPHGRFRFVVRLGRVNQPVKLRVVAAPPRQRSAGHRPKRQYHSGTTVFRAVWRAKPTRQVRYPDVDVVWPAEQVLLGTDQVVTGHLAPDVVARVGGVPGSSILLQRQVLGLWTDVSATALQRASFRLAVPTDYLGHFSYRLVIAAPGQEQTELTETSALVVVPSYSPRGQSDSHAFISSEIIGRWNPCEPITYRVNAARARPGVMKDVRTALARVAAATGLRFEYLGTTDVVPFAGDGPFDPAVADLVIAWVDPRDAPGLFAPGVYGLGGPEMSSGAFDASGQPVREIWQGGVVFTTKYNYYLDPGSGEGPTRVGALMHEIGHAVGLAHVDSDADDKGQIMYPSIGSGVDRWGAGDLAGLEALGATQGCVSVGASPAPLPAPVTGGVTAGSAPVTAGRAAGRRVELGAPLP